MILALFAGSAAGLGLFVWRELSTASPVFDLQLFRDRTFASAAAAIMTVDVAMMGCMFMLVIYMESAMDYTELRAALVVTAVPAAAFVLAPFGGRLVDAVGPRVPAIVGALLTAAGLYLLGRLQRTAPVEALVWRTVLVGLGSRPVAAGLHRRGDGGRAGRRPRRRVRHAQHGTPAGLPPGRRHPRRRLRAHHDRRREHRPRTRASS